MDADRRKLSDRLKSKSAELLRKEQEKRHQEIQAVEPKVPQRQLSKGMLISARDLEPVAAMYIRTAEERKRLIKKIQEDDDLMT